MLFKIVKNRTLKSNNKKDWVNYSMEDYVAVKRMLLIYIYLYDRCWSYIKWKKTGYKTTLMYHIITFLFVLKILFQ